MWQKAVDLLRSDNLASIRDGANLAYRGPDGWGGGPLTTSLARALSERLAWSGGGVRERVRHAIRVTARLRTFVEVTPAGVAISHTIFPHPSMSRERQLKLLLETPGIEEHIEAFENHCLPAILPLLFSQSSLERAYAVETLKYMAWTSPGAIQGLALAAINDLPERSSGAAAALANDWDWFHEQRHTKGLKAMVATAVFALRQVAGSSEGARATLARLSKHEVTQEEIAEAEQRLRAMAIELEARSLGQGPIEEYGFKYFRISGTEHGLVLNQQNDLEEKVGSGANIRIVGGVVTKWKEKPDNHRLTAECLTGVLDGHNEVLIIGTGYWNMMKCDVSVESAAAMHGIAKVVISPTLLACREFNRHYREGRKVAMLAHGAC